MSDEPIRPGYKRTEVGIIPEDWEVTTIGDIFRVSAAGDLDKTRFSAIRDANYDKPIYSNALENKGLYGYASYSIYPAGTITVTARGTLGFAVFRDHDYVAIGRLLILEPSRKLDSRYFTEWINNRITFAVESTGVPQLTAPQISKYRLPLPSQLEQHVIADVLSDVDALLDALDRLIAKKRIIKQGAMQALLTGRVRLPGFTGEWQRKKLGDVAEMRSGGTPPTSVAAYYGGNIPWVSISDMTRAGKVIIETERNLSPAGLANCTAQIFPAGTVMYAMYASIGECSIAGVALSSSQAILGIRPGNDLNNEYLYYNLSLIKSKVKNLGQQGTQANLNAEMVRAFELQVPPLSEQLAIAEVLSNMDAEIDALEKRRAKLRDIKQGMMQELLTGRIRLVQPKESAQEAHV